MRLQAGFVSRSCCICGGRTSTRALGLSALRSTTAAATSSLDATYRFLPWQPKTKRSTRTVPIPPATVDLLQRLKVRCGGGPYLFVDLDRLSAIDTRIKAGKPAGEMVINFSSITTTAEYYTEVEDSAADRLRKVFERVA